MTELINLLTKGYTEVVHALKLRLLYTKTTFKLQDTKSFKFKISTLNIFFHVNRSLALRFLIPYLEKKN